MPRSGRRKIITSINVEPDDYATLKAAANRRRVPLAYVVREILHREVERWYLQQAPATTEPATVPA
jgi:hypothetical protein